ncbi:4776_t:CDS:2, partial [Funneliformis caledonium]
VEAKPEVRIRLRSTAGLAGLKNGLSSKITASYLEEISFKWLNTAIVAVVVMTNCLFETVVRKDELFDCC